MAPGPSPHREQSEQPPPTLQTRPGSVLTVESQGHTAWAAGYQPGTLQGRCGQQETCSPPDPSPVQTSRLPIWFLLGR